MAQSKVQTVQGNGGAYINQYTISITPTAGNELVLDLAAGAADFPVITDNKGNTWIADKSQVLTSQRQAQIWRAYNVASGATTITVHTYSDAGHTSDAYADTCYILDEISGSATSSALDQTQGANTTSGTSYAAGSVTTTQANEILIGCIAADSNSPSYTGDAGWNTITTQAGFDLFTSVARQYRVVSSTGTYSWTVTNASSRQTSQAVATYKAAVTSIPNTNYLGFF